MAALVWTPSRKQLANGFAQQYCLQVIIMFLHILQLKANWTKQKFNQENITRTLMGVFCTGLQPGVDNANPNPALAIN